MSLQGLRNRRLLVICTLGALGLGVGIARAGIPADPDALLYSGVLEEDGVLVDDTRALRITVFDALEGGAELCTANDPDAAIVRGRFRVAMPGSCAQALRTAAEAFVEVRVADVPVGARARVGAVPYALEASRAAVADTASFADTAADADNATNAVNASNATNAVNAVNATNATNATTASALDCVGCLSSGQLATNAVGGDEIASSAVGSAEIATDAVNSAHIQLDAVGGNEIAAGAVGSGEIQDGAVSAGDIGGGQVNQSHATFAPRVVRNGVQVAAPSVFAFTQAIGVPGGAQVGDTSIDISAGGFAAGPACTVTNRNEDATGQVILSASASATTLSIRVRRIDGFNVSTVIDIAVICVGS